MRRYKYNKRDVEPKQIESPFGIEELFFSVTDPKGIILRGNSVFVKVSKFKPSEIIKKPHNIIRHPDMPRAVFKALWDTIKAKKPFVGYVKNMAKDGSFYWVLAAVYPVVDKDGNIKKYISIRLKPSTELFETVKKLYEEIREYEEYEGMDKALELMLKKIKELGYESYEDFSKDAFFKEMMHREELLKQKEQSCQVDLSQVRPENMDFIDTLCNLQTLFYRINRYYNEIFGRVQLFLNLNSELNQKSKFIYEMAEDIRLLSLNASIESYKIKKEGVSFSTLSHEMRKNAEFGERKIVQMSELIADTKKDIEDIGFDILTAKLVIEMIVFFVKEMIGEFSQKELNAAKRREILENINDLFELLKDYTKRLYEGVNITKSKFRNIQYNIQELNVMINRLDFIHINGLIESAHTGEEGGGFNIIFSQMLSLIEAAKKEIINLHKSITDATEDNSTIQIIVDTTLEKIIRIEKQHEEILKVE